MKGNKAIRRALKTTDAVRIEAKLPLITDRTELITPQRAEELLKRNTRNRPINWEKVEEYSRIMQAGKWELHSQGIILDEEGNILTGQKRLWAVALSGITVPMRVSTGNLASVANLLDRGTPQSARDLASRATEKRHSPIEASVARAMWALRGNLRPTVDAISEVIVANAKKATEVLAQTAGTKKTKAVLMIIAACCELAKDSTEARRLVLDVQRLSELLDAKLLPQTAEKCWGKGAAFSLAMEAARSLIMGLK